MAWEDGGVKPLFRSCMSITSFQHHQPVSGDKQDHLTAAFSDTELHIPRKTSDLLNSLPSDNFTAVHTDSFMAIPSQELAFLPKDSSTDGSNNSLTCVSSNSLTVVLSDSFIGASSNSLSSLKDLSRNSLQDESSILPTDIFNNDSKDLSSNSINDLSRNSPKDVSSNLSKDLSRNSSKDTLSFSFKDTSSMSLRLIEDSFSNLPKGYTHTQSLQSTSSGSGKDISRYSFRGTASNSQKHTLLKDSTVILFNTESDNSPKDVSTDSPKDVSTDSPKDVSTDSPKDVSTDSPKEGEINSHSNASIYSPKEGETNSHSDLVTNSRNSDPIYLSKYFSEYPFMFKPNNSLKDAPIRLLNDIPSSSLNDVSIRLLNDDPSNSLKDESIRLLNNDPSNSLEDESIRLLNDDPSNSLKDESIRVLNDNPSNSLKEESTRLFNDDPNNSLKDESISLLSDDPNNSLKNVHTNSLKNVSSNSQDDTSINSLSSSCISSLNGGFINSFNSAFINSSTNYSKDPSINKQAVLCNDTFKYCDDKTPGDLLTNLNNCSINEVKIKRPSIVDHYAADQLPTDTEDKGFERMETENENLQAESRLIEPRRHSTVTQVKSVRAHRSVSLVGILVNLFVLGPLVVTFWNTTWVYSDYILSSYSCQTSLWSSAAVGFPIMSTATLLQSLLISHMASCKPFSRFVLSRAYTYMVGLGCTSQWRSVWMVTDCYFGFTLLNASIAFAIALVILLATRCLSSVIAPPVFIAMEVPHADHCRVLTFLAIKPTWSTTYLLDTLLTVFLIQPAMVIYWCCVWRVQDLYLLPEDSHFSATCSIGSALGLCSLLLLLQEPMNTLSARLQSRSWWARLIFQDMISVLFSLVCINYWRGIWLLLDLYLPFRPYSLYMAHGLSFLILVVSLAANTALVRDISRDGNEMVTFDSFYLAMLLRTFRRKTDITVSTELTPQLISPPDDTTISNV